MRPAAAAADVATEATATHDLKLKKTRKLASQLTNAEWLASMPGTDAQKNFLLDCNGCHTFERIARSTHDAAEWAQVITRMKGYAPVSQPIKPQRLPDEGRAGTPDQYKAQAQYLASINLSAADSGNIRCRRCRGPRAARPTSSSPNTSSRARRSSRTTCSSIRRDRCGTPISARCFISKFDPKTLKLTEYPVKELKPGFPEGNLDLEADKEGTLWFDTMFQGALGSLDPATGKMNLYPLPPQYDNKGVQLNFVGLRHEVDGKVWTKDVGSQHIYRLDLASGKWDAFDPTKLLAADGRRNVYQVESDSHNNLWMAEFTDGHLGKIDAKTGKVTWYDLPTQHARARRIEIDAADRVIVTEYQGNKVAIFDPVTEKITEYPMPVPWFGPYRAQTDKNGEIWTGGMNADRVVRTDPKTGQSVEYLMPSDTNMRTVFIDNSTNPVTFWTGSNHGAALVKVEPLD